MLNLEYSLFITVLANHHTLVTAVIKPDTSMLRYIADITWRDSMSNAALAERCGVKELNCTLGSRRLTWFSHVTRRDRSEVECQKLESLFEDHQVDQRGPEGKVWKI